MPSTTLFARGRPDQTEVPTTGLEDRGRQNPAVTVIGTTIGTARQSFRAKIIGDQSDALPVIGATLTSTATRAAAGPPTIHLLEIATIPSMITETAIVVISTDADLKSHRPPAGGTGLPRTTIATNVTTAKGPGE